MPAHMDGNCDAASAKRSRKAASLPTWSETVEKNRLAQW